MAQLTAVEWLRKISIRRKLEVSDFRQAKEMEKHQIMSAYDLGNLNQYNKICKSDYVNIDEEQYYNEKYNK